MNHWDELIAIVLAGGRSDRLAAESSLESKGLVPYNGVALGTYVLKALAASRYVKKVVLVGASDLPGPTDLRVAPGERLIDSLVIGCEAAGRFGSRGLLVVSCDLPWLKGEAIDKWI